MIPRLRYRDDLPLAKVVVWRDSNAWLIYVQRGMRKGEARSALRAASHASGMPLTQRHAALALVVFAGLRHLLHGVTLRASLGVGTSAAAAFALWGTHAAVYYPRVHHVQRRAVSAATAPALLPAAVHSRRHHRMRLPTPNEPLVVPVTAPAAPHREQSPAPSPTASACQRGVMYPPVSPCSRIPVARKSPEVAQSPPAGPSPAPSHDRM